ncbi:hypothetical protein MXE27_11820, partial [Methanobacterium alcaliphilum]
QEGHPGARLQPHPRARAQGAGTVRAAGGGGQLLRGNGYRGRGHAGRLLPRSPVGPWRQPQDRGLGVPQGQRQLRD